MRFLFFLLLIIPYQNTNAQITHEEKFLKIYPELDPFIKGSLNYLKQNQQQETDSTFHFKGEWGTEMSMNFWFPLMGGKNKAYDSNCYAVATIYNILAKTYLTNPVYKQLLPVLDLAFDRIMAYESGGTFNFWNALAPTKKLKLFDSEPFAPIRRPNNFALKMPFIQKAANVANDADDTAAGLASIYYHHKIKGLSLPDSLSAIHKIFDAYVDKDRNNRLWYDFWQGHGPESGAYLTWFGEEYRFSKRWNPIKEFTHFFTFYLPISKMYPKAYKPYIPYGSNDLDMVVNANVLNVLSLYGNDHSEAKEAAIQLIEKSVLKKNYNYAATYYPNRYHIPYYVAKAYDQGVEGLEVSIHFIQEFILNKQLPNGAWISRDLINDGDSLQSTVYAVYALLHTNGITDPISQEAILKGLQYIFSKKVIDQQTVYWPGGVFFSGGTIVRHVLHWKSDAVTTATVLEILIKLKEEIEQAYAGKI